MQIDNTTYLQLKHIAMGYMLGERKAHTLSPTALVNEAYLRFHASKKREPESHTHFLALAAREMRHILVDHARARNAQKRGDGIPAITLHEELHSVETHDVDILALDTALIKLQKIDDSKVRIVEMRYFSGMTLDEIAVEMEISVATVKRKWTTARAWLFRELAT